MKKIFLFCAAFCLMNFVGSATDFYSQGSSTANTPANWNTVFDGSGVAAVAGDFTTAGNTWIVQSAMTLSANWVLADNSNIVITIAGSLSPGIRNITLGGDWTNDGTFTAGTGTVIFNAASTGHTLNGSMTGSNGFNNIQFNNAAGEWSFGANAADVGGNFTLTASAAGGVTAPSSTLKIAGNFARAAACTFVHNSGTIELNGAANQTIPSQATTFHNLHITNTTGTVTATTGAITVDNTLTTDAGSILNMAAIQLLGAFTAAHSGTLRTSATVNPPFPGGNTWGGDVTYTRANGGQRIPDGTYNNLTFNNTSGTNTANGDITVNNSLVTTTGTGIMFMSTFQLLGTITTLTNNGRIQTASTANPPIPTGRDWTGTTGRVTFSATTGGQSIPAGTYKELFCSNTSNTNTVLGDIDVSTTLTATGGAAGTFDLGTNLLTGTFTPAGLGTIATQNTTATPVPVGKAWTGTINYNNATGSQTVVDGTYTSLRFGNSSGTTSASADVTMTSVLTTTSGGTFDLGTNALIGAAITTSGTGTLTTQNTTATPLPTGRTWTCLVNYNAAAAQTIMAGTYTGGLAIENTSGTSAATGNILVAASLNIPNAGATFDMSTFALSGVLTSIVNNGTVRTSNTSAAPVTTGKNWTGSGTVEYSVTGGGQTIMAGTYNALAMLNTSGTNTASNDLTVNALLTTTAGGVFAFNNVGHQLLGAFTPANSGTIQTICTVSPSIPAGNTWGGTVIVNRTTGTPILPGGTFNNLTFGNAAGTVSVIGSITVNSALVTTSGGTVAFTTNQLLGAFTVTNDGAITTTSTANPAIPAGKDWTGTTGSVAFAATTGNQFIPAGTYKVLTCANTSNTNTVNGDIDVSTTLQGTGAAAGAILNMGVNVLTGTFTYSGIGQLHTQNLSAAPIPTGGVWTGTIHYNATTGAQTIMPGTYTSLTSGNTSGTNSLVGGDISVSGTLTNTAGGTMDLGTNVITSVGTPAGTGTLATQFIGANPVPSSESWTGTVNFNAATGGQTIPVGTYAGLTLDNASGITTAGGALTVNTALTITNPGATLAMSTFAMAGTLTTITNNGTLRTSNTSAAPFTTGKTYGGTGTVLYFLTTGGQTVMAGTYTNNLTVNNSSGTNTASGVLTVNGTLTTTAGGTLNMSTFALAGSGTPTHDGILRTASLTNPPIPTGKSWNGDVIYTALTGAQTLSNGTFNALTFNNTSGTNTAIGDIIVNGAFTTTSNGILAMGTNQLLGSMPSVAHGGTLTTSCNVNPAIPSGKNWSTGTTGLITFGSLTGGQFIPAGTYRLLSCANTSGTNTVTGTIDVTTTFTSTGGAGGSTDLGTNLLTGAFTPAGAGTLLTQNTTAAPIPAGKTWTGTVNYNAATGLQTVSAGTYATLTLDNTSGTTTAGGALVVNTALNINNAGATLDMSTNAMSGTLTTITNNGTIVTDNTSATPFTVARTWGGTGTVVYNVSTGGQTVVQGTYNNLILNNSSGTDNAGNDITVNGTLTTTAGGTFLFNNIGFQLLGTLTADHQGILETICTVNPAIPAGTTWGGQVNFSNLTGAQEVPLGTYNDLSFLNTSGTQTSQGDLTVNGALVTTSGGTLALAANLLNGTLLTITNNGTISTTSTANPPIPSGRDWTGTTGRVNFLVATGGQTIPAGTYGFLACSNTSGTNNVTGNIDVSTNFTSTGGAGGTTDMGTNLLTGTFTPAGAGTLETQNNSVTPIPAGKTWTGTVNYNRTTGGQTAVQGTYATLALNNTSGTTTAGGALTVNTALNVANAGATLDMTTFAMGGTMTTVTNNGTVTTANTSATPFTGGRTWNGTGTVIYNVASGGQTVMAGTYANNVTISNTSGTNTASGILTINGTLTTTAGGTLNMITFGLAGSGTPVHNGVLNTQSIAAPAIPAGNVWGGSIVYNRTIGAQTIPNGTFNVLTTSNTSGSQLASGDITVNGAFTTTSGGILVMGVNQLLGAMSSVSHGGTITTSCNVNPAIPAGKDWSTGTTGLITFGRLTGGQFIPLGTYKTLTCNNTSGTNTAVGNITVTGTVTANGAGGTLDMSTFALAAGTLTNSATGTIRTQNTSASPIPSGNVVAGTVIYEAATGGQTIVAETSYSNLTQSNSSGTNTANGNIVVNGTFTTGSGTAIFDLGTNTLSGGLTSIAGAGTILTANTSAAPIKTGQTWPQTIVYNAATGGQTIMNGTYNGGLTNSNTSGTNTLAAASTSTVNGDLTLSASSVLADNNRTLTVSGNILGTGTHNTSASGLISMTGAGATISGATLGNLTLNNAGGFSLTGDPTINGTLTLTSGLLTIGSNNFTLGTAAPAIAGSPSVTNMIVATGTGEVRKMFTATGSYTYPIGDAGPNYTPATIDLTSGTPGGGAYAGMNVTNAKHPDNASATDYLNRYWSVSLNNIATPVYSLTGTYVSGDVAGTEASIASASYDGALPWTKYSVVNTASNLISTTGITAVNVAHSGLTGTSPSVDVTPAVADVCNGVGEDLVASGSGGDAPYTYSWAPAAGLSATTGATVTATQSPTVATTYIYTVTVTDANGFTAEATATLSVNPAPAISDNALLCYGATMTLTATPGGGTWMPDDTNIVLVDTLTGLIYGRSGGTTIVSYTDLTGCTNSVEVTVNPQIADIVGPLGLCESFTTTFTNADGTGTWSSSDVSKATIDINTGFVTAIAAASITLSYTIPNGCFTTTPFLIYTQPTPITGTLTVCEGSSTLLQSLVGGSGTWISTNTGVATIGSSSGLATGVASGTSTISYVQPTSGCFVVAELTVNQTPTAITGGNTICVGSTFTLGSTPGSGTWTSSNTSAATIGSSSGDVTGVSGGNTFITYTLANTCFTTQAMTVNNLPSVIGGTLLLCPAGTSTLTSTPGTGAWSSITPAVATINSGGVVSPLTPGNTTISYTLPTGCARTAEVTVNAAPPANTGTAQMCVGGSTTLANGSPGGTWSSSNTSKATVGISTGIVTGVATGTSNITYKVTGNGCYAITEATVDPAPAAITGTKNACVGFTSTLGHVTGGGTWTSSNPAIGTVDAVSGVVGGIAAGIITITYATSASCFITTSFTVKALPAAITGNFNVCVGTTTQLADATPSGTWSTSNASIALIHTVTGLTYGISIGNANITYHSTNACYITQQVTVNAAPAPITGTAIVCAGSTTTLNGTPGGGTWATSNGAIATVGTSTGIVTGVTPGTAIITYTDPSLGCAVTKTVTVGVGPGAISGTLGTCIGSTTALTNGTSGGVWTSSNTGVATVGTSSGIVTGVSAGTSLISYTVSGCLVTAEVTVDVAVAANTGVASACVGGSSTLDNPTGGGFWSSEDDAIATVDISTGVVDAVDLGTVTITYAVSAACYATTVFTVTSAPAAITGTTNVCVDATITLSHGTPGGTWSSSDDFTGTVGAADGVVGGISAGVVTITYDLGGACIATHEVLVGGPPTAISGTLQVCEGFGSLLTSEIGGSGTWSSSAAGVASVHSTSGFMTGVADGNATITYTSNVTGCFTTAEATVDATPSAITGVFGICVGSVETLSSSPGGGAWTSSSPAVASIDISTGDASGLTGGSSYVSYTSANGCYVIQHVTVNNLPSAITGALQMCPAGTATLSSATGGGAWSSVTPATATIDAGGVVTPVAPGTTIISYTLGTGCAATAEVTIDAAPPANTGTATVCVGGTTTLSNGTPGGNWTSSNTSVATVGASTGIVSGIGAGNSDITYTLSGSGCYAVTVVTITGTPSSITGTTFACVGSTSTLGHASGGGTWTSSNIAVATVGSSTGLVSGITTGTIYITYTLSPSCYTVTAFTVRALPAAIGGTFTTCIGSTTSLTNATPSGTWSSSNTGIALIHTISGLTYGISAGTATITYHAPNSCYVTQEVTVDPAVAPITGTTSVCVGSTTTLNGTPGGGVWSSSNSGVASVGTADGIVTGVSAATATITYIPPASSCRVTITVTVGAPPAAIGGTLTICTGNVTTLTNATGGGTWTSAATGVATIGSATGQVTGVSAGNAIISYNHSGGCVATATVTVNAPIAANTGTATMCIDGTTTLDNATGGGTWSSSNASTATVGTSSGIVSGISAGTATITYLVSGGCFATTVVTVSATASAITGASSVCVGSTLALGHATGGGTWSSSNPAVGSVNAATGLVAGLTAGGITITYDVTAGCSVTKSVNVNALPPAITGTLSVCEGAGSMLSCISGGSGTWSSSATGVATVGSASGLVTGVSVGNATITYTSGTTGCYITAEVTVNALPAAITGTAAICAGATPTYSSLTGGGTWTSSNTSAATIGSSSGVANAVSAGNSTITYMLASGCYTTLSITVNPIPSVISGYLNYCQSGSATLSSTPGGGAWTSDDVAATISVGGLVTATNVGTSLISYTLGTGCARTTTVTVLSPLGANTGSSTVCVGATSALANGTPGGTWTSSVTGNATVGYSSGIVTGVSAGTSNISYVIVSVPGCSSITQVTVNAAPSAITGTTNVCVGDVTTLSHGTPGGTWSSSHPANGTVNATTGDVTGLIAGGTYITYTLPTGCYAVAGVTVKALPGAITGATTVCEGYAFTPLSCTPGGGTWISSNTSVALIHTITGVVYGVNAGDALITYKATNNCMTTRPQTVNANPSAISGTFTAAIGGMSTLSSAPGGGDWTSSDVSKATVGISSGTVTGVDVGTPTITYTLGTGCYKTQAFTVTASRPGGNIYFAPAGRDVDFSVFPNPTSGIFTIEAPGRGIFTVYTLDGKKIIDYEITRESTTVSLPYNLAAGSYMCTFTQEDGKSTIVRLSYQP